MSDNLPESGVGPEAGEAGGSRTATGGAKGAG